MTKIRNISNIVFTSLYIVGCFLFPFSAVYEEGINGSEFLYVAVFPSTLLVAWFIVMKLYENVSNEKKGLLEKAQTFLMVEEFQKVFWPMYKFVVKAGYIIFAGLSLVLIYLVAYNKNLVVQNILSLFN